MNLNEIHEKFLLNEGHNPPSFLDYAQALDEILDSMNPASIRDQRRVSLAKENIRNLRRYGKRVQQENKELKEKIQMLEETSAPSNE